LAYALKGGFGSGGGLLASGGGLGAGCGKEEMLASFMTGELKKSKGAIIEVSKSPLRVKKGFHSDRNSTLQFLQRQIRVLEIVDLQIRR